MSFHAEPRCGQPGCRREADYLVTTPEVERVPRCRWHADAVWRPYRSVARVERLHAEVPEIDLQRTARSTLLPAVIAVAGIVVVALGFAVIAPIMF